MLSLTLLNTTSIIEENRLNFEPNLNPKNIDYLNNASTVVAGIGFELQHIHTVQFEQTRRHMNS